MVVNFANIGALQEQPLLVLKNADGTVMQTLGYAFNRRLDLHYNEVSTLSFDLPAYVDGQKTPHFDDVVGMRIVELMGIGQFVLVNPETEDDGLRAIRHCKAYSLEYELTYRQVFFPEGTYKLWDPLRPGDTVMGILLEELPTWSIGQVDTSILGKYRSFSDSGENLYNFLKSTVQQAFGCVFDFDTMERRIHIRSITDDVARSPVYISFDNLAKEIRIEENSENIVTVLDVRGADGVDIRRVNPMGSNKIYNLDHFVEAGHFSHVLEIKWNAWKRRFQEEQQPYFNLTMELCLASSAILTEQSVIAEQESKLQVSETNRSVCASLLAQLPENSQDRAPLQIQLDLANEDIEARNLEIARSKENIATYQSWKANVEASLRVIQNMVSFSNPEFGFTQTEELTLNRYFKEDSIEDSSFFVPSVDSYDGESEGVSLSDATFTIDESNITEVKEGGKILYSCVGGRLTVGPGEAIEADVIRASLEFMDHYTNGSGQFILTAYVKRNGEEGNISIQGICGHPRTTFVRDSHGFLRGESTFATVERANLYYTTNVTEYQRQAVAWELYEYGVQLLEKLSEPTYSFQVNSANFLTMQEFRSFADALRFGESIYLNTGERILNPLLIGASIDLENPASFSLEFSNQYRSSSDTSSDLASLLEKSVSMGKRLDASKLSYSAFVESGASNSVKDFMGAALDLAKNKILSASGIAPTMDDSGLHLRKYLDAEDPSRGYEREEIAMINNSIVFTDDGWQTVKMAIGKIFGSGLSSYAETKDTQFDSRKTYYVKVYGQYQEWYGTANSWNAPDRPTLYELEASAYGIAAPYIVGNMVAGENLIITTKDGSFRVDEEGVFVDALKFYITHNDSEAESIQHAFSASRRELDNFINRVYFPTIGDIDRSMSGRVNTFYQKTVPSDYFVGTTVQHDRIVLGESREGDLWYDLSDSENMTVYRYTKLRSTENGCEFGWVPVEGCKNELLGIIDNKVDTYYQSESPHENMDAQAENDTLDSWVGDLWYNTEDSCSYLYTKTANADDPSLYDYRWNQIEAVPEELYDKLDTKRQVFVTPPIPPYDIGDLWVQGSYGDINRCKISRAAGEPYDLSTDWVKASKYTDDSALDAFKNAYLNGEFLDASKMKGYVNSLTTNMGGGRGNVVFDQEGFWLLNRATKETSTQAIWMNERGIVFGSGTAVGDGGDLTEAWEWTTAIGHDGIVADAIAGKTISGIHLVGGDINIGNGNFTVSQTGDLVANSGTFRGTLDAPKVRGNIEPDENEDAWLKGCGINVGDGAFYVDKNGNVTMRGSIDLSEGSITWNGNNTPVRAEYSVDGVGGWHDSIETGDYYARYSYDGGVSWTSAILIRGKDGENGKDGKNGKDGMNGLNGTNAYVTFQNVNAVLGTLWRDINGNPSTTITDAYMQSPNIRGGRFYGSEFYAGSGYGYTQMNDAGLNVFDAWGCNKIGLGYYSGNYNYPYLSLGVGSGTASNDAAIVMKFGSGVWIGTSDVISVGGYAPPAGRSTTTGVFVDFADGKIYQYINGDKQEIGSGSSESSGTAVAVFG